MNIVRISTLVSFACLLFAACGSSKSTTSTDGGTGGRIGTGGGTGGTGTGGPGTCAPANNTCTAAETNAYSTCVQNACDASYRTCLGPNYRTGSYSGPCGAYYNCFGACACNDTACILACGLPVAECQTCLLTIQTCTNTCTQPACFSTTGTGGTSGGGTGGRAGGGTGGRAGGATGGTTGGGTGGGTGSATACADFMACCNASTNATVKSVCLAQYGNVAAMGNDACATALAQIKPAVCP